MKYQASFNPTLIYVFRINDNTHADCLKIGQTALQDFTTFDIPPNSKVLNDAAKKRINQYTQTAAIEYELLYTELTLSKYKEKGSWTFKSFTDEEVHKVLINSGVKRKRFNNKKKATEWFVTDLATVKKAIEAVKQGKESLHPSQISKTQNPIVFRPEQRDAIDSTKKAFKKGQRKLWNAKMRFGKTLSALQLVKEMGFVRTLIITHRPVVDKGWFDDFEKIFYDDESYNYGSKNRGSQFATLESECKKSRSKSKYIYFASMQDLRGSEEVGGKFDKNDKIFKTNWDLVIVDEAHEGTQTELGKNVIDLLNKEETKLLELSGTPFNLFDNYSEDEIYTWDYVMEQRAKADWDKHNFSEPNPYASLPKLNIFTFDIKDLVNRFTDDLAFNFQEFFRVDEFGEFIHEQDISSFLDLISQKSKNSNYPYSTEEFRGNFRHSLWMVPGVKEAKALSKLLKSHSVFKGFEIVNVAGDGDEEESNENALTKVEKAITDRPHETYTITLSCGRLTTGVSVPAWTAVFMLSGSYNTSASAYMQTIFRVQTPATINGKIKEECFVFDFAPDRTLKVLAEVAKISAKAGKTSDNDRNIMGEFLNFCPVISVGGTGMSEYSVDTMLEQLKKAYVERVVRNGFEDSYLYDNDQLMKLSDLDLKEFDGLKKIIGSTKAMPKSGDIDINNQGFTDEEYEKLEKVSKKKKQELSDVEKALLEERKKRKENRDAAVSILRGISIRMPLLIYGADINDENEAITIDNFTNLVDDESWNVFMPKGVDKKVLSKEEFNKFKKYYEPDVFRAAGKRIRAMARAADNLPIEERIARITSIFATFRNPDKETVLTPWRVVNMHLGDCLGGYVFLDEMREKTLPSAKYVSKGEVTQKVFSPESRVLEINSKSGLYPLYVAYSIFRNRVSDLGKINNPNSLSVKQQQDLWDRTIKENIYVLCMSPMAESITQRTLVGFRKADVNTKFVKDIINEIAKKPDRFIKQVKDGKSFWQTKESKNMKFDAIVGNPPYQVMDGGAGSSAKPIYNKFVEIAKKVMPTYLSMITPSRWFAGGKGLDEFRINMLNDNGLVKIFDFINAKECFPNTSIGGGINYFLWDKNSNSNLCSISSLHHSEINTMSRRLDQFDVFVRYNEAVSIIEKVSKISKYLLFSGIVSTRNPFGLSSKVRGVNKNFRNSVTLYSSDGISYLKPNQIDLNNQYLNVYKVMISKVTSEHAGEPDKNGQFRVLSKTEIRKPNEVCTDSYLVVGKCSTTFEVDALYKYMISKFFRFLLLQAVSSINLSKDKFGFIPLQDFTSKSDIDWTKSIEEIDNQLYDKYNLDEKEREFIEKMIKPM